MSILIRQRCSIHDLSRNPMMAAMAAQIFAGSRFHRGLPKPRYAMFGGEEMEKLDELNRGHVIAALKQRAHMLGCPVDDLMWALGNRSFNGVYPVLMKRREDVERDRFERRT